MSLGVGMRRPCCRTVAIWGLGQGKTFSSKLGRPGEAVPAPHHILRPPTQGPVVAHATPTLSRSFNKAHLN